jgi:CBS domain-containing protein
MIARFECLSPADTLEAAGQALLRTTQHEFPVLDPQGRPAGFLTRQALFKAMAEDGRHESVGNVMTTAVPSVAMAARLETALDALQRDNAPAVAVVDREGRFVGYITAENLGELMILARAGSRER